MLVGEAGLTVLIGDDLGRSVGRVLQPYPYGMYFFDGDALNVAVDATWELAQNVAGAVPPVLRFVYLCLFYAIETRLAPWPEQRKAVLRDLAALDPPDERLRLIFAIARTPPPSNPPTQTRQPDLAPDLAPSVATSTAPSVTQLPCPPAVDRAVAVPSTAGPLQSQLATDTNETPPTAAAAAVGDAPSPLAHDDDDESDGLDEGLDDPAVERKYPPPPLWLDHQPLFEPPAPPVPSDPLSAGSPSSRWGIALVLALAAFLLFHAFSNQLTPA